MAELSDLASREAQLADVAHKAYLVRETGDVSAAEKLEAQALELDSALEPLRQEAARRARLRQQGVDEAERREEEKRRAEAARRRSAAVAEFSDKVEKVTDQLGAFDEWAQTGAARWGQLQKDIVSLNAIANAAGYEFDAGSVWASCLTAMTDELRFLGMTADGHLGHAQLPTIHERLAARLNGYVVACKKQHVSSKVR